MVDDLPKDGIENEALVDGRPAASALEREVGCKEGRDDLPLFIGQVEGRGRHWRGIFE
jgi:hypothetical protein